MRTFISFITIILLSCYSCTRAQKQSFINGVSFVAPPSEIDSNAIILPKKILAANYLSLMPYAFIPENSTDVIYNTPWQWWGEKKAGTTQLIQEAKKLGYQIMLKPHVWLKNGAFTGQHTYSKENDWKSFEEAYITYILDYAHLAESFEVEIFCIGTEWEQFVLQRPSYWLKLIEEVKKVYHGKLTYAANWDEYHKTPFWNTLDFIGVDAYFPLIESTTPNTIELKKAMSTYKVALEQLSKKHQKQILFTEYGYRSINNNTEKPWESSREGVVNLRAQVNAYQAFYQVFWEEDFIAGGFIWKWFSNYHEIKGEENNGFTPQQKSVEQVIKKVYDKKH